MLFSSKQFFLAGMYGCNVITEVLAFSDEVLIEFLSNCCYINKRLIYCLIVCKLGLSISFSECPRLQSTATKRTILEETKKPELEFPGFRFKCACAFRLSKRFCILVPRSRAPFGQHQESRPLGWSSSDLVRFRF